MKIHKICLELHERNFLSVQCHCVVISMKMPSAELCSFYATEHRRGVAGGGWEDDDDDGQDAAVNMQSNHSISSNSAAGVENDRLTSSEI